MTASPDGDWDAFVESAANGSYMQLSAWAAVKAVNGWSAARIRVETAAGPVACQVLTRRAGPLPWSVGYAPRGPALATIGSNWVGPFTMAVRQRLAGQVSEIVIDPEIDRQGPGADDLHRALTGSGWVSRPAVQPDRSRLLDLTAGEAVAWSGLRGKWRQYVNSARREGVTVEDGGEDAIPLFYAIYRETADRAGFIIRSEDTYRTVWRAYAPAGRARLLIARLADGTPAATLLLLRCGNRVVEPYGGMTAAGAQSRANYLVKWEAIQSSIEAGAHVYDMWGLSHAGIAHFKAGFGGREVAYVGTYGLVLDRLGSRAIALGRRASIWMARRRHGLTPVGAE